MTAKERQALEALKDPLTFPPNIDEDSEDFNINDICDGADTLSISHARGEFGDLVRGVLGEVWRLKGRDGARRAQCVDNCMRHDRVLWRNDAFNEQIQGMTEAYLIWSLEKSQKGFKNFLDHLCSEGTDDVNGGQWPVTVVDTLFAEKFILKISSTNITIASALVHQGIMPCSPISPVMGITSEALELYRVVHLRSPHLSIQAFIKTICDLLGVEFQRQLSRQFSSSVGADTQEDLDEEEVAEEVAEEALRSLQDIILITDDFLWLQVLDDGEGEE
ncbi:uncharacterized protein F5147DRAFT_780521 [Suillus discolor]|uniref:Uncharacterized protein n=1 Tax=Suillus discolor TaxID=1912936 RepID=A0A9P7EUH8_9AGAM|nr:uncharacterized protein F5147DRAFT_780521 [Suillus discolor]KAG2089876.1 hypothetical protein F5147DRAFT_780521 [Suillus discolor]